MQVLRFSPLALLCAATLLGLSPSSSASVITVQNGSFESTSASVSAQINSPSTSASGSIVQTVTGWTSGYSGTVPGYSFVFSGSSSTDANGLYGTAYGQQYGALSLWGTNADGTPNGITSSPDGGNFLAMDGAFEQTGLSQSITGLTVGMNTTVAFFYAGAQQSGFDGATTETFAVSLSDGSATETHNTVTLNDASHGFTGWHYTQIDFTPTSTTETLTFLAVGTPSGVPPFSLLDGVSIVQVTPEPSTLALLGTGLVSLCMLGRRRFSHR